jgi:hypothetical protein
LILGVDGEISFDADDELHLLVAFIEGVNGCGGDFGLGGGGGMLPEGAEGTVRGGGMTGCLYTCCSFIPMIAA